MHHASPVSAEAEDISELVRRAQKAASAFMRGKMHEYFDLIRHTDDFTLMAPFGGPPTLDFDATPERLAQLERYFKRGDAQSELVRAYASGDIAVLVMIEHQHGEVGGLPDQDWSLRVTLVFRREGAGWRLAHRHADPLVHGITLEQAAAIARGTRLTTEAA